MRYLLLIYAKESDFESRSPEERQRSMEGHLAVIDETVKRGVLVGVNPLARTTAATTVRVENGKVLATDGPFAETREQLAGYYVLDCRDLNQAIAWAARIPTACGGGKGSIEIRQLTEFAGVPESVLKPHPAWADAANG
jgi:hypothetical protein